MTRSLRALHCTLALVALVVPAAVRAQDTTYRGITLNGVYDPTRDKWPIAVLPVSGAFGDSVSAIIQRDLDFSDRFTLVTLENDPTILRGANGTGLNYPMLKRLGVNGSLSPTSSRRSRNAFAEWTCATRARRTSPPSTC